jgi:hypothetical protein
MSNSKASRKVVPLRHVQATGKPKAATFEDLQGVLETMRVARRNGLDMTVQLHVGAITVDVTNLEAAPAAVAARTVEVETLKMPADRFTKVSKDGKTLPANAAEWEGVYDAETGLIWGRALLPGEHTWKDAIKKASEATLCGAPARAPTIQERTGITDYARHSPALSPLFAKESAWEWTSTPDAESPSDVAWGVYLGNGGAVRGYQSNRNHVRAVRAGQPIGL